MYVNEFRIQALAALCSDRESALDVIRRLTARHIAVGGHFSSLFFSMQTSSDCVASVYSVLYTTIIGLNDVFFCGESGAAAVSGSRPVLRDNGVYSCHLSTSGTVSYRLQ